MSLSSYEIIRDQILEYHKKEQFGDCVEDGEPYPCPTVQIIQRQEEELAKLPDVYELHEGKVNRIEVIDAQGRAFIGYYDTPGMTLHLQDDRQTLKVYAGKRQPVE